MKRIYILLLLLVSLNSFSQQEAPETIVQKQVDAYNQKDLELFLSYYSDDVKVYNFPCKLTSEGKEQLRKDFEAYFGKAKTLNCKILKRIVRKNMVIDEEQIKFNDIEFSGVAVYEIENNKIVKVTFIE